MNQNRFRAPVCVWSKCCVRYFLKAEKNRHSVHEINQVANATFSVNQDASAVVENETVIDAQIHMKNTK